MCNVRDALSAGKHSVTYTPRLSMIDSGGKSPLITKKHSSFLDKKNASAEEFQGIRLDGVSRLHVHVHVCTWRLQPAKNRCYLAVYAALLPLQAIFPLPLAFTCIFSCGISSSIYSVILTARLLMPRVQNDVNCSCLLLHVLKLFPLLLFDYVSTCAFK